MESELIERLDRIEKAAVLGAKNILTVNDLCLLYGMKRSFLYKLTSGREIPFYRRAKTIYFKRDEVEAWLTQSCTESKTELQREALNRTIRKENNL